MLFTAGTVDCPARVPQQSVTIQVVTNSPCGIVSSNGSAMDEGSTPFDRAPMDAAVRTDWRSLFGGFVRGCSTTFASRGKREPAPGYRERGSRRSGDAIVPARYHHHKTSLWLHTLERTLGWPVLQRIMSTYFDQWKFRHPRPADFFAVVSEVSGQDMTWFFDQVSQSNVFDYGVQRLRGRGQVKAAQAHHVVAAAGEATFPTTS
jgi:hypothetical protein